MNDIPGYFSSHAVVDPNMKVIPKCFVLALKFKKKKQDLNGYTLLHHAITYNHLEIVQLLLRYSADPNVQDLRRGYSSLHEAVLVQNQQTFNLIVSYSSSNAKTNVNIKDKDGWTPLHFACLLENFEMVKQLLRDHAADIMATTSEGKKKRNLLKRRK